MQSPHREASAAVAACAIALLVGCGSGGDGSPRDDFDDSTWSSLGATIAVDHDTAAKAARRYVLQVAVGASPFAIAMQVPEVTRATGTVRMARALERAAVVLLGARVRSGPVEADGPRARVTVAVSGPSIKSARVRFALVRRRGRWFVAYDSLTQRALAEVESIRVARRYLSAGSRAAGGLR